MFVCPLQSKKRYSYIHISNVSAGIVSASVYNKTYTHCVSVLVHYMPFFISYRWIMIFFWSQRLMSSIATLLIRELSLQHTAYLHFVTHPDKHFTLHKLFGTRSRMSWKCFSCCRSLIFLFGYFHFFTFALLCFASFENKYMCMPFDASPFLTLAIYCVHA